MNTPREVMPPGKSAGAKNTGLIIGGVVAGVALLTIIALCGCAGVAGIYGFQNRSRVGPTDTIHTIELKSDIEVKEAIELKEEAEHIEEAG